MHYSTFLAQKAALSMRTAKDICPWGGSAFEIWDLCQDASDSARVMLNFLVENKRKYTYIRKQKTMVKLTKLLFQPAPSALTCAIALPHSSRYSESRALRAVCALALCIWTTSVCTESHVLISCVLVMISPTCVY